MQLRMSLSMEQVLADAQLLVGRLKEHDSAADNLLSTSQTMYRRIDSMKQYEAGLNQLNEMGRHRPRSNLILALVKENNQIRQLQQENKDLRACLEEHQSAIELIMSKYREQVAKLLLTKNLHPADNTASMASERANVDKICEMAAVMRRAASMEEESAHALRTRVTQLETENRTLRQLLKISHKQSRELTHLDSQVQVDMEPSPVRSALSPPTPAEDSGPEDSHFAANDAMNNSVIENNPLRHLFAGPLPKPARTTSEYDAKRDDGKNEPDLNGSVSEVTSGDSVNSESSEPVTNEKLESEDSDGNKSVLDTAADTASEKSDKISEDMDTTVVDNNSSDTAANTTVLETTLVPSEADHSGEHVSSASDNSGSEESPAKSGAQQPGKKTKGSGKKSGKSGMVTIKRGKGRNLLQDLNANTGTEKSNPDEKADVKVT